MNSNLPATGTVAVLELLNPLVPDDFINQAWPHGRTAVDTKRTPPPTLSRSLVESALAMQSLNLLVKMLPEQRAWRTFAGLCRQNRAPDVRMQHEFRARLGVAGLRRINSGCARYTTFG